MKARELLRVVVVVLGASILASCSDSSDGRSVAPRREPGTLAVSLMSATNVGAVRFELPGGGVANVRAARGDLRVFSLPESGRWEVAVVGTELSGDLVKFDVADVSRIGAYSPRLVDAADGANDPIVADGPALSVGVAR